VKRIKATTLQIKALMLIFQGYSVRRSMKEAGYGHGQYNQSTRFFKMKGVQATLKTIRKSIKLYIKHGKN